MSLFSIKMRASREDMHISGAEKLVEETEISESARQMIGRGLNHSKGSADFLNLKLERIPDEQILFLDALPVTTLEVESPKQGILAVYEFLESLGIEEPDRVMELFRQTYGMRGAMLLDISAMTRLEPDQTRGIRATYMDRERRPGEAISQEKIHFPEALVLATKVANSPGMVGEICISDDPDYVTGYVASREIGYRRITQLKEAHSPLGGRIFLFDSRKASPQETIRFLEQQPVIVKQVTMTEEIRRSVQKVNPLCSAGEPIAQEGKLDFIDRELNRLKEAQLYRTMKPLDSIQSRSVVFQGRRMMMLASNSYLDLISHPQIQNYTAQILQTYGAGSGGSRLTTGTTTLHIQLEQKLAEFKHTEAALVFNTGYTANLAVISALADPSWIIFSDQLNHASIIDGCRLSRASVVVYRHNDMNDLEEKILAHRPCRGLIVSDAVFSMDGDILNLPKLVELGETYQLLTMVDEAHSTGVIGNTGRGIMEYYHDCCPMPDILMGTLSKSIGSEGGFVCARKNIIDYLINKARGFIFSTSLSPVSMAASYMGLCILEQEPERTRQLQENVAYFCGRLREEGIEADSETAIVPILIGEEGAALRCQERLQELGYFLSAIRYPTVAKHSARLRVALMSSHTKEELSAAARDIARVIREVKQEA